MSEDVVEPEGVYHKVLQYCQVRWHILYPSDVAEELGLGLDEVTEAMEVLGAEGKLNKVEVTTLFELGNFKSHSGETLPWKIDCDVLTLGDWECLARMVADRVRPFSNVEGVPRGGFKLQCALGPYRRFGASTLLIVDDVLTTGGSMEEQRAGREAVGAVVFARGPCPSWVTPLFQMGGNEL